MDEQGQPRFLRRKILRNSLFIFVGFILIVLCFIFLGIAETYHRTTWKECSQCHGEKKARTFRLVAAIFFVFGFTIMTTFWWHLRAIRSAFLMQQHRLELDRLLGNRELPIRRRRLSHRSSLGLRNSG